MNGYFYHGIEYYYGTIGYAIQLMVKILDEGLLKRSQARDIIDEKLDHICLYKKNDEYDYDANLAFLRSARSGWIDRQFVFIIKPNINARKIEVGNETDLVDEWRCFENIAPTNFVGVALPFDSIQEYLNEKKDCQTEKLEEDKKVARQYLPILIEKAQNMNITIVNSEQHCFTDAFDANLSKRVKG